MSAPTAMEDGDDAAVQASNDAPLAHEKNPIPFPKQSAEPVERAGESDRPASVTAEIAVVPTGSPQGVPDEELHGPEYVREM